MANERPESKAIRKNCTKIANAIADQGLTQWFATKLEEEDFIAHFPSVMGVTQFTQVTQMLTAVQSKLKTTDTPVETFRQFIEILECQVVLIGLTKHIKAEYKSCGGTAYRSSSTMSEGSKRSVGGKSTPRTNHQPVDEEYEFGADDLPKLMCLPVAADWWNVGIQLGIPTSTLATIKASHPGSPQNCLSDAFDWWLKNGEDVTYDKLETALKNTEHGDAVKKLSELYGSVTLPKPSGAPERGSRAARQRKPLHHEPEQEPAEHGHVPRTTLPKTRTCTSFVQMLLIMVAIGILSGCAGYLVKQTFWPNDSVTNSGTSPTSTVTDTPTGELKGTPVSNSVTPTGEPNFPSSDSGSSSGCTVIDDVKKVFRAIENNISDWKLLGEELGINPPLLERINREQHGEQSKLRETIREWQKRVSEDEFCWEKLIDALKVMNEIRLAKSIAKQYGIKWKDS